MPSPHWTAYFSPAALSILRIRDGNGRTGMIAETPLVGVGRQFMLYDFRWGKRESTFGWINLKAGASGSWCSSPAQIPHVPGADKWPLPPTFSHKLIDDLFPCVTIDTINSVLWEVTVVRK